MLFKSNTYQINKQAIQFLEMIKNTNQNYVSEEQFRHLLGLILQSGCYTIDRKNKEDIDFHKATYLCIDLIRTDMREMILKIREMKRMILQQDPKMEDDEEQDRLDNVIEALIMREEQLKNIIIGFAKICDDTHLMAMIGELEKIMIERL